MACGIQRSKKLWEYRLLALGIAPLIAVLVLGGFEGSDRRSRGARGLSLSDGKSANVRIDGAFGGKCR